MATIFRSRSRREESIPTGEFMFLLFIYFLSFGIMGMAFMNPGHYLLPVVAALCAMTLVYSFVVWLVRGKFGTLSVALLLFSIIAGIPALMGSFQYWSQ